MSKDKRIEALKAVAHPVRLLVLETLRNGEMNVGEIEEAAQVGQPTLSQQLAVLRKAGLVTTRKHAKLVYYRIASEKFGDLAAFMSTLGQGPAGSPRRPPAHGVANFARLS